MDFDIEIEKPRVLKNIKEPQPEPQPLPPLLTDAEREEISTLVTFNEVELNQLVTMFEKNSSNRILSETAYLNIIGKAAPLLKNPSELRDRIYYNFNFNNELTIIPFIISVSVLCGRSTFISLTQLTYNIMDLQNYGMINTFRIDSLFSNLSESRSNLLLRVKHPGGLTDVTLEMYIRGWNVLLSKITPPISLTVFEETLKKYDATEILLFPFLVSLDVLLQSDTI